MSEGCLKCFWKGGVSQTEAYQAGPKGYIVFAPQEHWITWTPTLSYDPLFNNITIIWKYDKTPLDVLHKWQRLDNTVQDFEYFWAKFCSHYPEEPVKTGMRWSISFLIWYSSHLVSLPSPKHIHEMCRESPKPLRDGAFTCLNLGILIEIVDRGKTSLELWIIRT